MTFTAYTLVLIILTTTFPCDPAISSNRFNIALICGKVNLFIHFHPYKTELCSESHR